MRLFYVGPSMSDSHASLPGSEERPEMNAEKENPVTPRPGSLLAARRQELGMTVEQAANQLNLAPRQVQAIEEENYAALPGMASVRGFMRAYAKLLQIEPEPLLAAVAHETSALDEALPLRRALPAKPFADSRLFPNERKRKWPLVVLGLLLLAFAAIGAEMMGWIAFLPPSVSALMHKQASPAVSSGAGPRQAPAATLAAKDAGRPESAEQRPAATASESPASSVAGQGQQDASGTASATPAPSDKAAKVDSASVDKTEAGERTSREQEKNGLTLKLREDSWIEIRKPDNSILVSRLAKAGSVESFALDGPVLVVIGNVDGVDATLRGKPFDLKAKAKNNVARLKLK